jgi:hypothetical protein
MLFTWFFLLHAKGGSFAPDIYMMVGPFGSLKDCEEINVWVGAEVERVSKCWVSSGDDSRVPPTERAKAK